MKWRGSERSGVEADHNMAISIKEGEERSI
jgi:hypothetical protein